VFAPVDLSQLFYVARERQRVYERRSSGARPPWTSDGILQNFRFANVYREQDKTTAWIAENWRITHKEDPLVWFAMVVARQFNLISTLKAVAYPVPWDPAAVRNSIKMCAPVFNTAYKIIGGMPKGHTTLDFVVDFVAASLWRRRAEVTAGLQSAKSLEAAHSLLRELGSPGIGMFMAAQLVAELKYTRLLEKAEDWWTWAAPGPGSSRGLNRVLGRPVDAPWDPSVWLSQIRELLPYAVEFAEANQMPALHAQDFQGWLCEYDKYERVRLGQGSLRRFKAAPSVSGFF
jgi:5-hmdU DNA kinase, helical domain